MYVCMCVCVCKRMHTHDTHTHTHTHTHVHACKRTCHMAWVSEAHIPSPLLRGAADVLYEGKGGGAREWGAEWVDKVKLRS